MNYNGGRNTEAKPGKTSTEGAGWDVLRTESVQDAVMCGGELPGKLQAAPESIVSDVQKV